MTGTARATRILIRGGRVYDHDGDVHQPAAADILIAGERIERIGPNLPAEAGVESHRCRGQARRAGFRQRALPFARRDGEGPVRGNAVRHLDPAFQSRQLRSALPRGGAAAHADRRGRVAPQRHHHDPGLSDRWCRRTRPWSTPCCRPTRRPASASCSRSRRAIAPRSTSRRSSRKTCPRRSASALRAPIARPAMSSISSRRRSSGYGLHPTPRQTWALAPSAPQRCSHELLEGIAALSRQHGLPVFTHVYETRIQAAAARQAAVRSFAARRAGARRPDERASQRRARRLAHAARHRADSRRRARAWCIIRSATSSSRAASRRSRPASRRRRHRARLRQLQLRRDAEHLYRHADAVPAAGGDRSGARSDQCGLCAEGRDACGSESGRLSATRSARSSPA